MQRKRDGLIPVAEVLSDLNGPVAAIRDTSPQARHHFTQADQVNQLVGASEADADLGFMARTMALCSLPRTNPGNQYQYKRGEWSVQVDLESDRRVQAALRQPAPPVVGVDFD